MLAYLLRQPMVAFDAEWKPIGSSSSSSVALIQFATNECVYLLDAVTIDIDMDAWNRLAVQIFNNCEILKIGEFERFFFEENSHFRMEIDIFLWNFTFSYGNSNFPMEIHIFQWISAFSKENLHFPITNWHFFLC